MVTLRRGASVSRVDAGGSGCCGRGRSRRGRAFRRASSRGSAAPRRIPCTTRRAPTALPSTRLHRAERSPRLRLLVRGELCARALVLMLVAAAAEHTARFAQGDEGANRRRVTTTLRWFGAARALPPATRRVPRMCHGFACLVSMTSPAKAGGSSTSERQMPSRASQASASSWDGGRGWSSSSSAAGLSGWSGLIAR
jgi:hypothetical protein